MNSLGAFPNLVGFPAGWALREITELCSKEVQGQQTTLHHRRENKAAQFIPSYQVPSAGSEAACRKLTWCTTPCVAAWTPFLHFERPEVIRPGHPSPPDDRWHNALSTNFPPCYTFETPSQGMSFSCMRKPIA